MGKSITPGQFKSHSGLTLPFKIECDTLSENELGALARHFRYSFRTGIGWNEVSGIPRGGLRFADALREFSAGSLSTNTLVVDDVYTTGQSMETERIRLASDGHQFVNIVGVVIVARAPTPDWIHSIFRLY